jgi:hypothetical protein
MKLELKVQVTVANPNSNFNFNLSSGMFFCLINHFSGLSPISSHLHRKAKIKTEHFTLTGYQMWALAPRAPNPSHQTTRTSVSSLQ